MKENNTQETIQLVLTKLTFENLLAQAALKSAISNSNAFESDIDTIIKSLTRLNNAEANLQRFTALVTPPQQPTDGATN